MDIAFCARFAEVRPLIFSVAILMFALVLLCSFVLAFTWCVGWFRLVFLTLFIDVAALPFLLTGSCVWLRGMWAAVLGAGGPPV